MKDSLREEDSPRESIEIDRKQCNAVRTVRTVHNNIERRRPIEVRMKKSIHKAVMGYCHDAKITAGQFYEEAAVLFMDVNPVDRTIIVVEKPERPRQVDLRVKVQELICVDELKIFIDTIDVLDHGNVIMMQVHKRKLAVVLKHCYKLKEWDDEITMLVEKAMSYFD